MACVLVVVFAMMGGVVSAHHGRSGYESDDKIATLKGVVAQVGWRNPHVFIAYDVTDDKRKRSAVAWRIFFRAIDAQRGYESNLFRGRR